MLGLLTKKQASFLIVCLSPLALISLKAYPGSSLLFIFFSISWLTALYKTLVNPKTYFLFFCTTMLFLGFWSKICLHFGFGLQFLEPIGQWKTVTDPTLFDRPLLISTIVPLCLLAVAHFTRRTEHKIPSMGEFLNFYQRYRRWLWAGLMLLSVSLNIFNATAVLTMAGMKPKLILPFHLNVLFFWAQFFFVSLTLAFFVSLDRILKIKVSTKWYLLFLATIAITAVSTLSRALFLFWTLPYLIVILNWHPSTSAWQLIKQHKIKIGLYLAIALFSICTVTAMRVTHYHSPTLLSVVHKKAPPESLLSESFVKRLARFMAGRWVGIEPVLATTAFPGGKTLLWKGLTEKPTLKHPAGIYTLSVLSYDKRTTFLPGLTAFLNYSHSLPVIAGGLLLVLLLLNSIEGLCHRYFNFPFVTVQLSFFLCMSITSFSVPYLWLVHLIEFAGVIVVLSLAIRSVNTYLQSA